MRANLQPRVAAITTPLNAMLLILFCLITSPLLADEIWETLKKGGKVILMRHLPVEQHPDPVKRDSSCKTEQALSLEGKQLGKQLAEKFTTQQIAIANVYTSLYCRTIETALRVFGKYEPLAALQLRHSLDENTAEQYQQAITHLIANYEGSENLVLVTHRPNIAAITFEQPAKGGFIILTPDR